MATITLQGNEIHTVGDLPQKGNKAPDFNLVNTDLEQKSLKDFTGSRVVLNIFPSVDTGVCAASVRKFNEEAANMKNTKVICISKDLPFAQKRFCGAEGLDNVISLSDFKDGSFGKNYGVEIEEGPFSGLHSRAVVVLDINSQIIYTEHVPEIAQEPDYAAVKEVLA